VLFWFPAGLVVLVSLTVFILTLSQHQRTAGTRLLARYVVVPACLGTCVAGLYWLLWFGLL
jgi:hypothetical protein